MIVDKIKDTEDLMNLKVIEKERLLDEIADYNIKIKENDELIIRIDLEKQILEDRLEKLKQAESYILDEDINIEEEKLSITKSKEKELKKDLAFYSFILEKIKSDKKFVKDYEEFIKEWKTDRKYHKGIIIKHNEVYFLCLKTHTSSFETIPIINNDLWEDIFKKNKVDFYYRDKTYMRGDLVEFYGVIYISTVDNNDSEPSEKNNKWRII